MSSTDEHNAQLDHFIETVIPDVLDSLYKRSKAASVFEDIELPAPAVPRQARRRALSIQSTISWRSSFSSIEDLDKLEKTEDYDEPLQERYHPTVLANRQEFLLHFAEAYMRYGGLSHRLESPLENVAQAVDVKAQFFSWPNLLKIIFTNENGLVEMHVVRADGSLEHDKIDSVLRICRTVVHDEISPLVGTQQLKEVFTERSLYNTWTQVALASFQSAIICPVAFGGSFMDIFPAAGCAALLKLIRLTIAARNKDVANVFEIFAGFVVAIIARALDISFGHLFCNSAISTSAIIEILPGFLLLNSALDCSSGNVRSGAVKLVFAVIYLSALAYSLRIGSDIVLAFAPVQRHKLNRLAATISPTLTAVGEFVAGNVSDPHELFTLNGTFVFTNLPSNITSYIRKGCVRPPGEPWYSSPLPDWNQWILLPFFVVAVSMGNSQRFFTLEMLAMCVNAYATFVINYFASRSIQHRPDVASAIAGCFLFLLSELYAAIFGGNAFTVTMTGVLLLVPTGLSQESGITGTDDTINLGGDLLSIVIGLTTGLQIARALVSLLGSRKTKFTF